MSELSYLPAGHRTFAFGVTTDSDGCVVGVSGRSGVTLAIAGVPPNAEIVRWQIQASADNADACDYKVGASPFAAQGDDTAANYASLSPDLGYADDALEGGSDRQLMRLRSSGDGDVTVYGTVTVRVTR